jgi:tocopherol O-methyltransferase
VYCIVRGEHLHHGYYGRDGKSKTPHKQAQIDMIDQLLQFGGIQQYYDQKKGEKSSGNQSGSASTIMKVLDVGCGIGGSSHHIAQKYPGTHCTGVTLSPIQVGIAQNNTKKLGLADQCEFHCANALDLPFEENSFDIIYSMESGEHMPDKERFLSEMRRVCKENGRIIMATWCHRPVKNTNSGDENTLKGPLNSGEINHLHNISKNYCLPDWVAMEQYVQIAEELKLKSIKTDDW